MTGAFFHDSLYSCIIFITRKFTSCSTDTNKIQVMAYSFVLYVWLFFFFLFSGIVKKLYSSYEAYCGKDNRGMPHHEWDPSYQPVCSPASSLMNSTCKQLNRLEFTCIGQQYLLTWWTVADVWKLQRRSVCELTATLFKCKIIIRDQYILLLFACLFNI